MNNLSNQELKEVISSVIENKNWHLSHLNSACQEMINISERENIYVTVATLDRSGQLNFLFKHPKAIPISLELAPKKAYSAYALQMDTSKIQDLTQPSMPLYQLESSTDGKIVSFAGGIYLPNELNSAISSIGVSGALDPKDDERLANIFKANLH